MAVIPGHLSDEVVILGNHNDAWTYGTTVFKLRSPARAHTHPWPGAGDPNSGTASVHEIVKALGVLLEQGWRPLRTIVLASWSGEEYGLIGSTEVRRSFTAACGAALTFGRIQFGEDFSAWLKEKTVAYVNVDVSESTF